jgi:single-stranded-DNA-specific exonuclease
MSTVAARPVRPRAPADQNLPDEFAALDPVLARLYVARGITRADDLDYSLRRLAPVRSLNGVEQAVDLLLAHRDKHIIIVGDFDADGATSTALVMRCLRKLGFASVDYLVPNRFDYGYGLTPEIVRVAAARSPDLLLTVDNGVSSIDGVRDARALGIEVLVTDHHLPGSELPDASVMVNPNLADCDFQSPHLAGVGVAFYLMAALGRRLEEQGQEGAAKIPAGFLDLVALGTVADVVQLDHNNRILVEQGIQRIRAGRAVPGIQALLRQAGKSMTRIVSTDLGFAVGPRLNAAGRLEDMSLGIECLLTDDADAAIGFAATLDGINKERRSIESDMRDQAFAFVDAMDQSRLPACVCLFQHDWHQGVVGLIASRVKDRCHRPVIAFARESEGQLKGSARSVPGVHIRDLLEAVATANPGLIDKFGGHAMAAGLSISESDFDAFSVAAAFQLARLYPGADFSGAILTDGELPHASLSLPFARILREGGPWGAGFPEPVFTGNFSVVEQRTVGENHLKLRVQASGSSPILDAIAFNQAGVALRGIVQLTYRLDVNEYRGVESAQLIVEQIVSIANN